MFLASGGVVASPPCLPLAKRCCRIQFPLLHRSRVHWRLSSSVFFCIAERQCFASRPCIRFASALHPLCIRRGARATGLVFTSLGTSHVALHCLRLALVRVRSACFICSFVLVVELDLAVLFILDISPASLVGLLVRAPRGSRILYPSPGAFDFTRRTLSPLAFP